MLASGEPALTLTKSALPAIEPLVVGIAGAEPPDGEVGLPPHASAIAASAATHNACVQNSRRVFGSGWKLGMITARHRCNSDAQRSATCLVAEFTDNTAPSCCRDRPVTVPPAGQRCHSAATLRIG